MNIKTRIQQNDEKGGYVVTTHFGDIGVNARTLLEEGVKSQLETVKKEVLDKIAQELYEKISEDILSKIDTEKIANAVQARIALKTINNKDNFIRDVKSRTKDAIKTTLRVITTRKGKENIERNFSTLIDKERIGILPINKKIGNKRFIILNNDKVLASCVVPKHINDSGEELDSNVSVVINTPYWVHSCMIDFEHMWLSYGSNN